jgi:hypothetical protein
MPKKSEKPPKLEVNAIRDGIEGFQHSILDYLQVQVAALKKFIRSRGVSVDDELDKFSKATESNWKEAVEEIEKKLE